MNSPLFLILAALWLVSVQAAEEGEQMSTEELGRVESFLANYFSSVREFDIEKLMQLVSRSQLEANLRSVAIASTDEAIIYSGKILFSLHGTNAAYCALQVRSVVLTAQGYVISLIGKSDANRESNGDEIEFLVVEEVDRLRLHSFHHMGPRADGTSSFELDVDVCHIPISEQNPAILLPDETPEQQAERLGIPLDL